jgi:hypothetical protein
VGVLLSTEEKRGRDRGGAVGADSQVRQRDRAAGERSETEKREKGWRRKVRAF